jgi:hypothetical protein
MSDTVLKLIPTSPSFVPGADSQKKATEFLKGLFPHEEIGLTTTDEVEFVHPFQNFEGVFCHICGGQIELEDFGAAMELAQETRFENLVVQTPCCSASVSLNDLRYVGPAGFSRFVIEIWNPHADLDESAVLSLAVILATPLRVVWAHI